MNFKKYTKAELISKLQTKINKTNQNNNSDQSLGPIIVKTFGYIKAILVKLTIITFLFKTFRKYSLIRRIWVLLNTIAMTIFGISILEIYGISFISAFFIELGVVLGNVVSYLTNTQIYTAISGIFGAKAIIKEIPTKMESLKGINSNSNGSKESSKISDWLNRKEEIIEDKDETNHRKYYLLLLLLLLAGGLSWYYWGDINPHLPSLPSILKSNKPKPKTEDIDPIDLLPDTPKHNPNGSLWDKLKFWKSDKANLTDSQLAERVKDLKTEAANKSISSKDSIDHYFPDTKLDNNSNILSAKVTDLERKLLKQLTGNTDKQFTHDSEALVSKINHFLVLDSKTNGFPNNEIKDAMFDTLKAKLIALSAANKLLFDQWISKNSQISESINKFINLENIIQPEEIEEIEVQSNTYEELTKETAYDAAYNDVAAATSQEQDVWSNKASTPSVKSPIMESENIPYSIIEMRNNSNNVIKSDVGTLQEIEKVAKDLRTEAIEQSRKLNELVDSFYADPGPDVKSAVKESFKENLADISSASSANSSKDHYFTKVDKGKSIDITNLSPSEIERRASSSNIISDETETIVEKPKSVFGSLMDQIKARRNNSNVIDDSRKESDQTPIVTQDVPDITVTHEDISTTEVKTGFSSLFDQIKSKRLEYGTPKISQLGLGQSDSPKLLSPLKTKPSFSNLFDDTEELFNADDNEPNIESNQTPAPVNTPEQIIENISNEPIASSSRPMLPEEWNVWQMNNISESKKFVTTDSYFDNLQNENPDYANETVLSAKADVFRTDQTWHKLGDYPLRQMINDNLVNEPLWNKIDGTITDNKFNIDFKDLWRNTKDIHFISNNNHHITFELNQDKLREVYSGTSDHVKFNFDWARDIKEVREYGVVIASKLQKVYIRDNFGNFHEIFKS